MEAALCAGLRFTARFGTTRFCGGNRSKLAYSFVSVSRLPATMSKAASLPCAVPMGLSR